jgi:translation initiation factor IF-1
MHCGLLKINYILAYNSNFQTSFDGKKRQCTIRGKIKKKEWMSVGLFNVYLIYICFFYVKGDIVLVSLHDFQDDKAEFYFFFIFIFFYFFIFVYYNKILKKVCLCGIQQMKRGNLRTITKSPVMFLYFFIFFFFLLLIFFFPSCIFTNIKWGIKKDTH